MSLGVIQTGAISWVFIIVAIIVAVPAVALIIFLFVRSNSRKREQEARMRERMIEMEREAQFAAASDRLPHSREPRDVASHIASLFHEYLSIPVLAVYVGRESDANLYDVLITGPDEAGASSQEEIPASVPASLLLDHLRPGEGRLAEILDYKVSPLAEAGPAARDSDPEEQSLVAEHIGGHQPGEGDKPGAEGRGEERVMLLPWRGPFGWNGLIVSSIPGEIAAEALEGYGEPLERLTDRLALALEFEHNDEALEAANQRGARTADFSRSVISYLDEVSPLDSIVREVKRLVDSDSAALWRVDKASSMVRMVAAQGLKSSEFLPLPLGQGLAGNVAQSSEVLAIEDAPGDPRCIFPREARESGITSYLGAPLASDGETLGVIEVHSAGRRLWTESDRLALESAATIITELVKSTDSRGDRLRVETAYLGLSEALQRLRSREEVKEAVVEVLGHALGASRVMVVEFDEQDRPGTIKQEYRQPAAKSAMGATFEEALVARVVAAVGGGGQPIVISNSREDSLMGTDKADELGVLSELAVPIRIDGKTRAIIYVHQCDREREWEKEELEFAERVVRQLSLTLSNLYAFELASTDAKQAREEARRAVEESGGASARVQELEKQVESFERVLAQSRAVEEEVRSLLAKASALEAKARAEADVTRHSEAEAKQQLEQVREELNQAHGSSKQLLDINKLKSEFIVNAGHEIEASLQSVLGLTEMLERGSYGELSSEQRETVHNIYGWARRIKSDVDWLIEYGSTRSRRLESSGGS